MPAKRRGKGFTRKKKKKSPSPPTASGGSSKKEAAAKKPPKTPAAKKASTSVASSKRKEKEAAALSVPRRVSPRLLAIKTKKMSIVNGSVIPVPSGNTLDEGVIIQPEDVGEHDHDHQDHGDTDREGNNIDNYHAGSNNNNNNNAARQNLKRKKSASTSKDDELEIEPVEQDGFSGDEEPYVEDDDQDAEQLIFERGTGPMKELAVPKIQVLDVLKEVEENYADHAVLLYFWKTGGLTVKSPHVKEWIYNNVGDMETIGSIRFCRDMSRGFFFVYFDLAQARTKALGTKSQDTGLQVTVFPWCSGTVNDRGEQCTPRMIVLPGLPDQFLPLLPTIGNSLGTYIGSIGALDPDANLEAVRKSQGGWESAFNSTPACEAGSPRIAVMIPPEVKVPRFIELQMKAGSVCKKQKIYEQLAQNSGLKRKAAFQAVNQNQSKRGKGKNTTSKKLKA